jgi:hypothetical protein
MDIFERLCRLHQDFKDVREGQSPTAHFDMFAQILACHVLHDDVVTTHFFTKLINRDHTRMNKLTHEDRLTLKAQVFLRFDARVLVQELDGHWSTAFSAHANGTKDRAEAAAAYFLEQSEGVVENGLAHFPCSFVCFLAFFLHTLTPLCGAS